MGKRHLVGEKQITTPYKLHGSERGKEVSAYSLVNTVLCYNCDLDVS